MAILAVDLCGETRDIVIDTLVIAGWAGRDKHAVQEHIDELAALGVPPPASTPIYYRVSHSRLTTATDLDFIGTASSGEAECLLVNIDGELWVGIGSDHTDREAETVGITLSKQMCDKPVGRSFWRFADVEGHWDELILRSTTIERGETMTYQDSPVSTLLPPRELVDGLAGGLPPGTAMFCGTVPVIGGIRGAEAFTAQLVDPVRERTLSHHYRVRTLAVAG